MRLRVQASSPVTVSVESKEKPTLRSDPAQNNPDLPGFVFSNWGEPSRITVSAKDASGVGAQLACLDGPPPCVAYGGTYDMGIMEAGVQASVLLLPDATMHYPVVITVQDDFGDTVSQLVVQSRVEAAGNDQVVYYGMAKTEYGCGTTAPANSTRMYITGISDATTYTVTDLTATSVLTAGTVNRGQTVYIASDGTPSLPLVDEHRYKVTASKPVQAFMGYDCSGTLPGTMFFLSDDGVSMYGTTFTIPFANWEATTPYRLQYWVFSSGAGTVTVKTIGGTTMLTNTFAAAGVWQIPLTTLTRNTTYAISTTGAAFAVEQSSQNAATEVPPVGQAVAAGSCSPAYGGGEFYFHAQPWNSTASQIAVFPYTGGTYKVDYWNGTTWTNIVPTTTLTAGTLNYQVLSTAAYSFHVTTTGGAQIGVLAGSLEPGPAPNGVWDLGDDAIYYRGAGNDIRGLAMRCGGTVFAAQDNTQLTVACTPGATCGITTGTQTLNADGFISISGDTADTNLFHLTTQDAQHPVLAEVFGGNCTTQLNDWGKIMLPVALLKPVITYPTPNSQLLSTTPLVTGTAVPGATITLFVYLDSDKSLVFTGTGTADSSGNWSIQVTTTLIAGTLYDFDAVQAIPGVCPVNPSPPPGSSGSSGIINVTPPVVVTPANGSSTTSTTPPITGTAPANTTVTVYIDGVAVGTAPVDSSGNWTYTPTTALSIASHTVYAIAKDGAGNTSSASNTNSFTVIAPSAYAVKTDSAGTGYISPGQTVTYQVTVNNTTASTTWTGVAVTDTLPTGLTYVAGSSQVTTSITNRTYQDLFDNIAYNGTDGTLNWASTPWTELNDDGVVTTGNVRVVLDTGVTPNTNALRLTGQNYGASRPAVLSGASSAALSFVYRRVLASSGCTLTADLSNDGGVTWSNTPFSISGSGTTGVTDSTYVASGSLTIPAGYLSSNFQLRFYKSGSSTNNTTRFFFVDNVQISVAKLPSTASAGTPPNLISGYTLAPGESLVVTFRATVDPNLSNAVTSITNTASFTANGGVSLSPSVTNPVLPAPVITAPINAGATSISGTSSDPVGSTITVYKNGVSIGTTTVQCGRRLDAFRRGSGLVGGESITATASSGGLDLAVSNTVVVTPAAPAVNSPIVAGATSVTGTSTAPVGSTVTVYVNGTPYTTTVQAGGTCTVTVPALAAGTRSTPPSPRAARPPPPPTPSPSSTRPPWSADPSSPAPRASAGRAPRPSAPPSPSTATAAPSGPPPSRRAARGALTGVSGLVGGESITATAGTGAAQSAVVQRPSSSPPRRPS